MEDTEYELVSHDEVDRLKKEIDRLKTNPFVQNSSEERFYEAISHLTESVNKLYQLFDNVNKQLMREYQTGNSPEEKIDKILDQNKSIAEALVSFGSKADSEQESQEEQDTQPAQETRNQNVKTPLQTPQPQAQVQQQSNLIGQTQNLPQQISQSSYINDDMVPPSPAQSQNQYQQPLVQQRQQIMQQVPQQMMFQQQVQTQPQQQQIRPQQMSQSQPQMSSMQQSQIPQAPLFQQNTTGYGSQRFQDFNQPPQQMINQRQQSQSSESDFDVNYPVPDRFQSLNSAPSFEPPIDLRPPEPKKKGLLGGLLKK